MERTAVSKFVMIALGFSIFALLLHLISFATPYWIESETVNAGLFQLCVPICVSYVEDTKPSKIKAAAAMAMLGFFVGVACLALIAASLCVKSLAEKKMKIVCMVLAFVAAFLIIVGVIIFGAWNNELKPPFDYGWSFILEILSGLLYLVPGIMYIVEIVMGSS